jgi:hypothetical protein
MAIRMLIASKPAVMGQLTVEGWLRWTGRLATAIMAASAPAMVVTSF